MPSMDKANVTVRQAQNGYVVCYSYSEPLIGDTPRERYHNDEYVFTTKADAFAKAEELLA